MKRTFLMSAAMLTCLAGFSQTETTWDDTDVNAASGCKAYVNEIHSGATANITDNNLSTSCQVRATGDNKDVEWAIIDLGYEYDITKISITTSGDRYDTGFAVYAASTQATTPELADGTDALDGSWGTAILTVESTGQKDASTYTRTYSVSASKVRYLKYKGVTRGENQTDMYGFTMCEFRIVGTTNDTEATKVASIGLTLPSLLVGNTGDAAVASYNSQGTKLGDLTTADVTLTSSNTDAVSVSGLTLTGVAEGTATITATYGKFTATGDITVGKNWAASDALAGSTFTAYASTTREGDASSVVGSTGNWSSYKWLTESGDQVDTNPWWFVDLGRTYNVKNIGVLWADCYAAEFEVYTASALTNESAAVSNDNVNWSTTAIPGTGASNTTTTTAINANGVRFIKIAGTKGGGSYESWGMRFTRFYLEGTPTDLSMTVGTADANGVVTCTGDWVEETFNSISGATVIDLTSVSGLPSNIAAACTSSPNAIVYAPSTTSGVNVCTGKGAKVEQLILTDGYDYKPESWFNVGNAKFNISLTKDHYSIVYLPFDVTIIPDGVTLYSIKSVSSSAIAIENVTSLSRENAYIIKADADGDYVLEGGNNPCGAGDNMNTVSNGVTITSTLTETTAPDGAYMFNASGELAKVSGSSVKVHAFAGYISAGIPSGAAAKLTVAIGEIPTGIKNVDNQSTDGGEAYNISGQRIAGGYKGLVIKNGKKYIAK